jgi:hypothetical protein
MKRNSIPRSDSNSKKKLLPYFSVTDLPLDGVVVDVDRTNVQMVMPRATVESSPTLAIDSFADQRSQSSEAGDDLAVVPVTHGVSTGNNRHRFSEPLADAPATPPRQRDVNDGHGAAVSFSPGGNRDRFIANCQPLRVCCDLSTVGLHNANTRFTMQAIVLIVYPSTEKPDRRHLQLIDSRGTTGLTVWGPNVHMFSSSSVGQVVRFTKLSLITHNGVKGLTMSRDSTVSIVNDVASALEEAKWWASLLEKRPLRIIDIHDRSDDEIVSVSAILGTLWSETKKVARFTCCVLHCRH